MATDTIKGLGRHYAAIVGCAAAFTAAAVITLGMRVVSKVITRAPFAWEDYTIGLAGVIYVVTQGLLLKATTVGRLSTVLNDPEDQLLTKYMYVYSIFYFAVIGLAIASILLLYRRVFIKPFIQHATTILLIITACWWIPSEILEIGYFSTLPERWPGEPKNPNPFGISYLNWWLSAGIIEQVIIIVAIMLPVREVYLLHLDLQKRLSLMLIFAISYICVGTGIARLATIYRPTEKDFDTSLGDIWLSSHLGTAIIAANLPVCWPVMLRVKHMLGMEHQPEQKWEDKMAGIEEARSPGTSPFANGGRVDSGRGSTMGSVIESATLGPTTKDGYVRDDSMVQDMESDGHEVSPSSSEAAILGSKRGQEVQGEGQSRKRSRWLELRPFNWRMTFSPSMFGSRASTRE